jgi:hypothetical protein
MLLPSAWLRLAPPPDSGGGSEPTLTPGPRTGIGRFAGFGALAAVVVDIER